MVSIIGFEEGDEREAKKDLDEHNGGQAEEEIGEEEEVAAAEMGVNRGEIVGLIVVVVGDKDESFGKNEYVCRCCC